MCMREKQVQRVSHFLIWKQDYHVRKLTKTLNLNIWKTRHRNLLQLSQYLLVIKIFQNQLKKLKVIFLAKPHDHAPLINPLKKINFKVKIFELAFAK